MKKNNLKSIAKIYTDLVKSKRIMDQFYMIEFEIIEAVMQDFDNQLIAQQAKIEEMHARGQVHSYFFSRKQSKLWMVATATSEFEILTLIEKLPLSDAMIPSITELMTQESSSNMMALALN